MMIGWCVLFVGKMNVCGVKWFRIGYVFCLLECMVVVV